MANYARIPASNHLFSFMSSMSIDETYSFNSDRTVTPKTIVSELNLPTYRKIVVLGLLCTAIFLDVFNNTSLFTALPILSTQLDIPDNESVWLFGAYQLTFSASLLLCGRVTDLFNPKWVFIAGSSTLAIFTLIAGFIRAKIPLLLIRALMGGGAALTIPSSQHIIVHMFTQPEPQAKALSIFAGFGAIGLVMGLFIGAMFVEFVSWPWTFHFGAILSGSITIFVFLLVPNLQRNESQAEKNLRFKRLDLPGITLITAGLIFFIYAVTSGSSNGWGSAQVIVTLILSVFLIVGFFIWESRISEDDAAVPPRIWKYENVTVLLALSFIPFMWWGAVSPLFSWYWQLVEGWSPMKVAVHFLPLVLGMFLVAPLTANLPSNLPVKWVILLGCILMIFANILLPFDNGADTYWRFGFPGLLLGTMGAATIYSTINIVLLANTPSHMSGVISALFMAAGQTGSAGGLAIVTSIQTSVQIHHGGPTGFDGRAAGLWFLMAISALSAICVLIFMTNATRQTKPRPIIIEETDDRSELQPMFSRDEFNGGRRQILF